MKCTMGLFVIVILNMLFRSSSDCIMMLENSNSSLHFCMTCLYILNFYLVLSLYNSSCEKLVVQIWCSRKISNESFTCGSASEVASPIGFCIICIREQVICFHWVLNISLFQCLNVLAWSRVKSLHVCELWIECFDESVKILEVLLAISVPEIISKRYENMIGSIELRSIRNIIIEFLSSRVCIIGLQREVILNWLVIMSTWICFPTEVIRLWVMLKKSMGENLWGASSLLWKCIPNPFKFPWFHSFLFILIVYSSKEHCIESHFRKQNSICRRMTKGIYLPASCWNNI